MVHLIANQTDKPEEDFKDVINNLFVTGSKETAYTPQEKPVILYSFYFSLPNTNGTTFKTPKGVFLCPGPDSDLDYDASILKVGINPYILIFSHIGLFVIRYKGRSKSSGSNN